MIALGLKRLAVESFITGLATALATKMIDKAAERWLASKEPQAKDGVADQALPAAPQDAPSGSPTTASASPEDRAPRADAFSASRGASPLHGAPRTRVLPKHGRGDE